MYWRKTSVTLSIGASRTFRRYASSDVRNLGIIAHIDAGKTTTTERMLYYAGVTRRLGDVDSGDTVTDFLPAERERGITIQSAAISLPWNKTQFNLVDTPGHADFAFEVVRSLRVLDGAVTILDAVAGVEALTETVWQRAKSHGIPVIAYINKMDRAGAGYGRTVKEIVGRLQTRAAQLMIPYFEGDEFRGVYDVIRRERIVYDSSDKDGRKVTVEAAEAETADAHAALIDTLSEVSEDVLNEFVEGEVSTPTLEKAIKKATLNGEVTPVFCGASFKNIGVQPLMDAIAKYLPPPTHERVIANQSMTCALAFKVKSDPMLGTLVYVRVYDGVLKKGMTVLNTATGEKERVTKVLKMQADNPVDVPELKSGDIGVILGTKAVRTGETLVAPPKGGNLSKEAKSLKLLPIHIPPPVFMSRITPKAVADQRGMEAALDVLLREDPSLRLEYEEESGQWLLSGLGELHLEIARDRLVQDLKANIDFGPAMITYKEGINIDSEATIVLPTPSGSEIRVSASVSPQVEHKDHFVDIGEGNAVRCKINRNPIIHRNEALHMAEIGVRPALTQGRRARLAIHGVAIDVSIQLPPDAVDPPISAMVRQAVTKAFDGIPTDQWRLLEPVMNLIISAPEKDLGILIPDLTGNRRGHIADIGTSITEGSHEFLDMAQGMWVPEDHTMYMLKEDQAKPAQVRATAPLRTLRGYVASLRSMTQGHGSFEMSFARFDEVPAQDVATVEESDLL